MSEKELPLDIVSQLEQAETALINLAPLLGSYYRALLKENIPDILASQLLRDYHNDLLSRISGNA